LRVFVAIALIVPLMGALTGDAYEASGNRQDERKFPLKGSWAPVQGAVSRFTRVCFYTGKANRRRKQRTRNPVRSA
jgi:hypothetical protein